MKINYDDKIVIITGGSSGIGLAVAKEFASLNATVIIISRDEKKLVAAKTFITAANPNTTVDIIAADIAVDEQITAAINSTGTKYGRIDVLINCAGISTCERFKDLSNEQLEKAMQVNYMGSVYATKAAWPYLKASKGQLSFVSSVAGYFGLIGYSSYAPTKFAMTGLAECLRFEGKEDGIKVSIIYPPDTETPMMAHTRQHCIPETLALSKNIQLKTATEVASIYIKGLQRNRFEIYCDLESRLVRWIKNNFPSLSFYAANAIINRAKKSHKGTR
ncbi:MAG: oxidoreductase, short chain dehydrogenase/reductase family [Segetibacter sp.]|nr:oxidoreductase, short chain dehydrogenase/reductase family [Segetibacter sp.]